MHQIADDPENTLAIHKHHTIAVGAEAAIAVSCVSSIAFIVIVGVLAWQAVLKAIVEPVCAAFSATSSEIGQLEPSEVTPLAETGSLATMVPWRALVEL